MAFLPALLFVMIYVMWFFASPSSIKTNYRKVEPILGDYKYIRRRRTND